MEYVSKKEKRKDLIWYGIIAIVAIGLAVMGHYSGVYGEDAMYHSYVESTAGDVKADETGMCPRTHIRGKVAACLTCHIEGKSFAVKESNPDDLYDYPNMYTKLIKDGDELIGSYLLTDIVSSRVAEFFRFVDQHKVTHVVIEIHSPGGSLLDAWRIVGIMRAWQKQKPNRIVETRVNGFAASAGFLVAISGDIGHRFVSRSSELMWHELWTFKMFAVDTPSSSEEESRVLRHLQDTGNNWVASRSKLTKKELDEQVKNKQLWCNGEEAVEKYGFADHLLN